MTWNLTTIKCPIHNQIVKYIFCRSASSGLNLWKSELTINHKHDIEKHWKEKIFPTNQNELENKEKCYVLSMIPYPSGSLHMGHVRVYTISDAVARFYRMQGKNVMHPIGWDSFGLPAENAAIERGIDPAEWTETNIKNMRQQLYDLGCSFDLSRELSTCDPNYYKWTQELFLKLYENGLVYQKDDFVNWDPVDQTVLADEQVNEEGKCWRSGATVEKKLLKQWFIKTTVFSQSLLEGLKDPLLKEWKDVIKLQQHWIGECKGTNFDFKLMSDVSGYPSSITLYTDYPEFIEDAKFVALSEKNLLGKVEKNELRDTFRKLNVSAINPFTNQPLPIYVVNKEEFPFIFPREDYIGIPQISTVDAEFCDKLNIVYEKASTHATFDVEQKREQILKKARELSVGGFSVSPRIKDWLISRQRYWGTPIPMVHCENCGSQPAKKSDLPILLPKLNKNSSSKGATLRDALDWINTKCPKCGKSARRETDTMDTFVDSSWYFMRYTDPKNETEIFSKKNAFQYLPVDLYIGGKEHATLHLYYARFISHFLHSLGLVPTREPFKQLLVQGMIKGLAFSTQTGKYLKKEEVEQKNDNHYIEKSSGAPVSATWEKMSKSKFNGVDPSEAFLEFSTDTIRMIVLGDVAPTSDRMWSRDTFPGILNWEKRLWNTVSSFIKCRSALSSKDAETKPYDQQFLKDEDSMFDSRNYYINGVTFNIEDAQQLSVAISKMQGLTNDLKKVSNDCMTKGREFERALAAQIIMLAPLAPRFASELWSGFCSAPYRISSDSEIQWDKDVLEQRWPEIDMEYQMKLKVKVNNKDFITLRVKRKDLEMMTEEEALQLVMQNQKLQKKLEGKEIKGVTLQSRKGCGAHFLIKVKNKKVEPLTEKEALN